ncbi:MAG: RtcB family protein [Nanoarchaeota archaeon]
MAEIKLKRISEVEWEIPKEGKMNVPGKVFASEKLIEGIKKDKTLEQVKNVAMLPGIIGASIALSDAHQGYGFPIGGVAAFDVDEGVISPGGVGYDINCGVRLLRTNLTLEDIKKRGQKEIVHSLYKSIPSGTGKGTKINLTKNELNEILRDGSQWCIKKGYGIREDYLNTEEQGKLYGNPDDVDERAKIRGIRQLGSIGSGNHFLEMQVVEKVFNKEAAKVFGLEEGKVTVLIHCGSRGLGHQVASDYIKLMEDKYNYPEQDRELVNAPISSELGKKYISAMNCAANFAFANRQIITHLVREVLKDFFPEVKIEVVYDVCHNIAKFEDHLIEGNEKKVLIVRKGATRSFGINNKEIPENYRKIGQPVLIPGTMGTSSYVLVGTEKAEEVSFASTAHGAGRTESRTKARKAISANKVRQELNKRGIEIEAGSLRSISEEAPQAYKDVNEVVEVSHKAGIGNLVVKLKPIGVIKG